MFKDQSKYNFKINEEIAVISKRESGGWSLELNVVTFNDKEAKYDLREWRNDHTQLRPGARFSESDLRPLMEVIQKRLEVIENNEQ